MGTEDDHVDPRSAGREDCSPGTEPRTVPSSSGSDDAAHSLPSVLDATVLVALGSAAAFVIAHQYEVGFARARGIPVYMVAVRPESIVVALLSLGSVAVLLFAIGWLASRRKPLRTGRVAIGGFGVATGLAYLWLLGNNYVWFGIIMALPAAVGLVLGARGLKSPAAATKGTVVRLMSGYLVVAGALIAADVTGRAEASTTTSYWTYEAPIEGSDGQTAKMVVLRNYGGILVSADLDVSARSVGPGYRITKAEEFEYALTREDLGRLATAPFPEPPPILGF